MADSLRDKLKSGRFVMTAEVTPPLSSDPADLLEKAAPLKGHADAVNETDGASARAHLDAMVSASILKDYGIEPILQVVCSHRYRRSLPRSAHRPKRVGHRRLSGRAPPGAVDRSGFSRPRVSPLAHYPSNRKGVRKRVLHSWNQEQVRQSEIYAT